MKSEIEHTSTMLGSQNMKSSQRMVSVVEPYELPEGWKWEKWGNVGRFIAGNGFKEKFQGFSNYNIPFYKVGSLKFSDSTGFLFDKTNTINDEILQELKATLIPENSIIFAKIGEAIRLNRRSINSVKCCIDNNLMAFLSENCNYKYVFFWSKSIDLYKYTNATTVPAIRKSDLEEIPFPLPPTLDEQQRIVNRIESMFAKLDEAKEKAQNVVDGFETRKAAILHKAFTGELTANWRRENGVSDDSWEKKFLKDICSKITDGTHNSPVNTETGDFKYITAKNIKESGIDLTNITFVSKEVHQEIYARCNVEKGDVLYIKDGATTGIAAVNTLDEEFSMLSSVADLKPINGLLDSKYLAYVLNSSEIKAKMLNEMSGNAITRLTLVKIKKSEIPVCSFSEQQEIVRILDIITEKENKAKQAAEAVLEQIDLLKKSILARAFRGEL